MKRSIRTVLDFPKLGVKFRDITGLLEDTTAFKEAIIALTNACMEFKCHTVVGIESRGFIFGSPIALDLDLPLVLARKSGKLPNPTVSKAYTLEYGEEELHLQELSPIIGNVVIIDDLIATGGTALACADLIHENWKIPKKNILILSVIDLPDLKGSKLIKTRGYKVKTLIEFKGE